jgi:hypothetical protein
MRPRATAPRRALDLTLPLESRACVGSHPPLGKQGVRWISPSPWEGREERAGRALSFRAIDRGAFCNNGRYCSALPASSFLLSDPLCGRVKRPIPPSASEGDWVLWPPAIHESR